MEVILKKTKKTSNFIRYQVVPDENFDPADLRDVQANMPVTGMLYLRPELVKGKDMIILTLEGIEIETEKKTTGSKKTVKSVKKPARRVIEPDDEPEPAPKKRGRPPKTAEKTVKSVKKPARRVIEPDDEPEPAPKKRGRPKKDDTPDTPLCRWCKFLGTERCSGFGEPDWNIDDPDEACKRFKERK